MLLRMKANLCILALLLLTGVARAETAYEALRSLGQARGEDILNQVVEVNAQGGAPQPVGWTVVTVDPMARGGVRVFGVRDGRILSEKTPTRGGNEPVPMNFNLLNLDSAGAFTVAEQEAKRGRLGFDRVNYLLQPGSRSPVPVWVIDLLGRSGTPVASIEISAENGRVVELRSQRGDRRDYAAEDRQYLDTSGGEPVVRQRPVYDVDSGRDGRGYSDEPQSSDGGFLGRMQRFGNRVGRHFQRDGAALQRFFTGETTIDPDEGRR